MDKIRKEYDYFGPWVLEIKSEDDITHEFMHVKDELLGSKLALKIPVDQERSSVKEGMVLYDTAIALTDKGVTEYKILDGTVFSSAICYDDILSIQLKENMLACSIVIESTLEKLHFNFDGVSTQVLKRFVSMIKDRLALAIR